MYDIIKNILQNLHNFLWEFVTNSKSGDNNFIFQSGFHNKNIGVGGRRRQRWFTPEFHGWPKNLSNCTALAINANPDLLSVGKER